jgi:hypothetical protein
MKGFLEGEGDRLFYMTIATAFGAIFYKWGGTEQLEGAGATILVGVAMYCFTRARSQERKPVNEIPMPDDSRSNDDQLRRDRH